MARNPDDRPDDRFLAWFERHFHSRLPFPSFAGRVALLSLGALAPALALYIGMTPGFASHLIGTETALPHLFRQVVTNGLPVVFAVNALSFILFAQQRHPVQNPAKGPTIGPGPVLMFDFLARLGLFVALHLVIYAGSALIFGSFGGDPVQALRVVGPTLAQAAGFGNLSGVYLYATLVSALPLQMALAERLLAGKRGPALPAIIPAALALGVIAAQFAALTLVSRALSRLV